MVHIHTVGRLGIPIKKKKTILHGFSGHTLESLGCMEQEVAIEPIRKGG